MSKPEAIIDKRRETLEKEHGVAELLERSLTHARESAKAKLHGDLFEALVPVPRPRHCGFSYCVASALRS